MVGNYTALEGKIPAQVNINGKSVSADDYLYASSSMILNLNQAKKPGLSFNSMGSAPNPAGTATGTLTKDEYLQVARNIKNFMETNRRSPNYASTSIGSVRYEALIYAHTRIINYYNSTGRLPNQVTIYQIMGKTGTLTRPKADYNYKIEGCKVQFQDKSTGNIQAWAWNLCDGTTSTERSPEHAYKPGTYNVTLTVKGYGVTDSKTVTVNIKDTIPPSVGVNPAPGTYAGQLQVTINAWDDTTPKPTIQYQVDNGPWQTATGTASITLTPGNHTIVYYAVDDAGNKASNTATYTIIDKASNCTIQVFSTAIDPSSGHWELNMSKLHDFYDIHGMAPEEYFMVEYGDPYIWEYMPVPEVYDWVYDPIMLKLPLTLNSPVKSVSVAWKRTRPFEGQISLIIDGQTTLTKDYVNGAWLPIKNIIQQANATEFYNGIVSRLGLLKLNNLTETEQGRSLWQIDQLGLEYLDNLTGAKIKNYTNQHLLELAKDNITIIIDYPGEPRTTIQGITFCGTPVIRSFTIYHIHNLNRTYNGQYQDPELGTIDAGYQGMATYTIATTKITDEILQEHLQRKPDTIGPLKAAYGTGLAGLEVIYLHDKIAEEAAKAYNVTWTRTKPVIVSVVDSPDKTFMTLECDHNMGVEAEGGDLKAFNYARTSAINPLEFLIMQRLFPFNGTLDNFTMELIMSQGIVTNIAHHLLKGEPLNITVVGEYTIISAQNIINGMDYLIIDNSTGIVRDINIRGVGGAYCFSHQQTEWARELGNEILNGSGWWKFIGVAGVSTAEAAILEGGVLSAPETLGLSITIAVVAIALYEHPEWLPYFEDAALAIILSPGGLPTFITYSLLTGDTQPIQNYLEILSRQSDGWTRRMVNGYRESVDTLRAVSSGGVGGDPDDIGRAINNLGKLMMDELKLFKEALNDGDVVGAIKHGGTIIGIGIGVVALLTYENRETIEICILGFKNYLEEKLREAGA